MSSNVQLISGFFLYLGSVGEREEIFQFLLLLYDILALFCFSKIKFSYFIFFVNNLLFSVFVKENMALTFHSHRLFVLTSTKITFAMYNFLDKNFSPFFLLFTARFSFFDQFFFFQMNIFLCFFHFD